MSSSVIISLIGAVARNRAMGKDGKLLWNLQEDLQRFKLLTIGKPVIMGRLTYSFMGKALPERQNIVMTSQPDFAAPDAIVVRSYEEAIAKATPIAVAGFGEIMVIGGSRAFEEALLTASRMYLTEVEDEPEGDVFFPAFDRNEWDVVQTLRREGPPPFAFVDYVKKAKDA